MKYLEELSLGDAFEHKNKFFILTQDFNTNDQKKCVCLKTGSIHWINNNSIVKHTNIYIIDHEQNILPIKPTDKEKY